jgi:hypothetical protein
MDRQTLREGKERVRLQLLVPLNDVLRLKRPRGVTEAAHLAGLGELQARLAYMAEADLVALREAVAATLSPGGAWPSPAVILGFAAAIRRPPPSDSPMVTSYMASAAGVRAREEGCHVALYQYLKDKGHPPRGDYDWRQIRETAEEVGRRRARLVAERDRGVALSTVEEGELARWAVLRERAEALIPVAASASEAA